MLKKILILVCLITGSFMACYAQQPEITDTTTFKLKDVYLGKSPLYILDGKIVEQKTVDALIPGTIERIDILKDDAATSAYGDLGKNGVVIFTSKGQPKQEPKKSKQSRS